MGKVVLQKIKVCILGADGQLGLEFRYLAPSYEFMNFTFYGKSSLDICDEKDVRSVFTSGNFDYVINCAAYTAVDKAESEIEKCFAINAYACSNIVYGLSGLKTKLIHISSDYVYNSYSGFPLKENDDTAPKGVYAKSKLEGESILRKSTVPVLILRTSWVISSFGNNFLKTMIRLGKEKSSIAVVNDQFGAPTYARHLSLAVLDIIGSVEGDNNLMLVFNDTYNFANEGIVSWYDIACAIMQESEIPCAVHPISTKDYPTPAPRPLWSVMSKSKIKDTFKLQIPHWYIAMKECIHAINTH